MYINTMTFTDQRVHCGTWTVMCDRPLNTATAIAYATAHGLSIAKSCKLHLVSQTEDEVDRIKQWNVYEVLIPYDEVGEILIWEHLDQVNDIRILLPMGQRAMWYHSYVQESSCL